MQMLVEDSQMRDALRKIVSTLAADPNLQEDLMQEGLIRLWRAEAESPGRASWYLNCVRGGTNFRQKRGLAQAVGSESRVPSSRDDDARTCRICYTVAVDHITFRALCPCCRRIW
jgi:hypothetical protein